MPRWPDKTPLERFAEKCAFDAATGCVMWVGGTTSGHGHHQPYGSFWFEGKRWFAHRWAAMHIHGLEITGWQVDHNCPCGPSTLCVQHLEPQTNAINTLLRDIRPGRAFQNLDTRQHWLFVSKGLKDYSATVREVPEIPYFSPPEWLKPFLLDMENADDCPF